MPAGRSGQVDILVQGLDAAQGVVASGFVSAVLQPGIFVSAPNVVLSPVAESPPDSGVPGIDAQAVDVGTVGIDSGVVADVPGIRVDAGTVDADSGGAPDVPIASGGAGGAVAADAAASGGKSGSGGGVGVGRTAGMGGVGTGGVVAQGGVTSGTGGGAGAGGIVGTGGSGGTGATGGAGGSAVCQAEATQCAGGGRRVRTENGAPPSPVLCARAAPGP